MATMYNWDQGRMVGVIEGVNPSGGPDINYSCVMANRISTKISFPLNHIFSLYVPG